MQSFFIFPKSSDVPHIALTKYPWLYTREMKNESREVRFRALEFLSNEYGYSDKIVSDPQGGVMPVKILDSGIEIFLSFSHSRDYVAFAHSQDGPIGIDIAQYEVRNKSLLTIHSESDYLLLGGITWYNFYILWTAKESIIKLDHLVLDSVKDIRLLNVFGDVLIFGLFTKKYKIHTEFNNNIFISYTLNYE